MIPRRGAVPCRAVSEGTMSLPDLGKTLSRVGSDALA